MEILQVKRLDRFKIPKVSVTPEGYLEGEVVASRTGVFKYLNFDGSKRRELRHPDHVLSEGSLKTLNMIPVTDGHPFDASAGYEFVDSGNASKYQKGFTGESYRSDEDGNIIVKLKVTDRKLIDQIKSGRKPELSLGYDCILVKESGEYKGERYDHKQTQIVYNHLAVVDCARAGRNARFRLDSEKCSNIAEMIYNNDNIEKGLNIMSDKDRVEQRSDSENVEIKQMRIDTLTAEKNLLEQRNENLQAKFDAVDNAWALAKVELEALKAKNTDSAIAEKVMNRTDLMIKAASVLGNDISAYVRHSDREIMEAVLKEMNAKKGIQVKFDSYNDDYVRGVFDLSCGGIVNKTANRDAKSLLSIVASAGDEMSMGDKMFQQLTKKA